MLFHKIQTRIRQFRRVNAIQLTEKNAATYWFMRNLADSRGTPIKRCSIGRPWKLLQALTRPFITVRIIEIA
jgi:hypothetical protein